MIADLVGSFLAFARRIKIHPHKDEQGNLGLRFQHPAPVELGERGNMGWREEDNLIAQVGAVC